MDFGSLLGNIGNWFGNHFNQSGQSMTFPFNAQTAYAAGPSSTLLPLDEKPLSNTSKAMYACNAMNNAVSLAASGKIEVSEIGKEFKRFFADLQAL